MAGSYPFELRQLYPQLWTESLILYKILTTARVL
jgi:hypothetical protein